MKEFDKKMLTIAAVLGVVTIGIGAFGAHGLEKLVDAEAQSSFETGVRYQMYHVIALWLLSISTRVPRRTRLWAFRFFIFGILLFSGSIYLLSLNSVLSTDLKFLGPVTPIGGLLLILGWLRLAYGVVKLKVDNSE